MIANPSFHRGCHSQSLVYSGEVVPHVMQRNGVRQVVDLFGKSVRQSRKAAHRHTHSQVLPFHKTSRDVATIGNASDNSLSAAYALRWAVADLSRTPVGTVHLDQHRVVNILSEGKVYCIGVYPVPVRRKLNPVCETGSKIVHEVLGMPRIAAADTPAWDNLSISTHCDPYPNVAKPEFAFQLLRYVLFFCVAELPNFVALDALAGQIPHCFILIIGTSGPYIFEEFKDGIHGGPCHAYNAPQRITLDQCADDLCSFLNRQAIHIASLCAPILYVSGHVCQAKSLRKFLTIRERSGMLDLYGKEKESRSGSVGSPRREKGRSCKSCGNDAERAQRERAQGGQCALGKGKSRRINVSGHVWHDILSSVWRGSRTGDPPWLGTISRLAVVLARCRSGLVP